MARRHHFEFTGKDLLLALSMLFITAIIIVYGAKSTYLRSKAYEQTATGLRIEAEEMNMSGNVSKDPAGAFVIFQ